MLPIRKPEEPIILVILYLKNNLTIDEKRDNLICINWNGSELEMKRSIIQKLREKGLKLTSQRQAIIDVLVDKTSVHPSASFIYQEARKKAKSLSLSTVYSTLNELSKHGIIKMLEFDRMENRYETTMTEHINLICKGCRKIMDYKPPFIIDTDEISRKSHFRVTDSRLEYYGYCEECRKK